MHNWHFPLLLSLTVLQPIFSEHCFIDGGRCGIHSSRSEKRLTLYGQYRFEKLSRENLGLNDQSEIHRNNRRIQRHILTADELSRINDRNLQRLILVGSGDDRSRYYKNSIFQNVPTLETHRYSTTTRKETQREHLHNRKIRVQQSLEKRGEYGKFDDTHTLGHRNGRNIYHLPLRNTEKIASEKRNKNEINTSERSREKRVLTRITEIEKKRIADEAIIHSQREVARENKDKHIIRRDNNGQFKPLKRHLQQTEYNDEKNINDARLSKKLISGRVISTKHHERRILKEPLTHNVLHNDVDGGPILEHENDQLDARQIINGHAVFTREEPNVRNGRTDLRYNKMNSRRDVHNEIVSDRRKALNKREAMKVVDDVARIIEVRNIRVRDEVKIVRNHVKHFGDTRQRRQLALGNNAHNEDARILERHIVRSRERSNNRVLEYLKENVSEDKKHSKDIIDRVGVSLKRSFSQEITRKITNEQTNIKSESPFIRNKERYSRDNTQDNTSSLARSINQKSTKMINTKIAHNRLERNINVRNTPVDIRNFRTYFNDNTHDAMWARSVRQENTRSIMNKETIKKVEKQNANVRTEHTGTRNYGKYSRDTFKNEISALERDSRAENERKITERQMVGNIKVENTKVVNEPIDIRYYEIYSKDNIHERRSRHENMKRIEDREMARNREERNAYERKEPIGTRNYARYLEDNNRDRTLSLESDIRNENIRSITDKQMVRYHKTQNAVVRNKRTHFRNDDSYLKDNIYDNTLSLEQALRHENTKRVKNTEMTQSRGKRSTDTVNKPTELRNRDRYSKNNINDRKLSLQRRTFQENTKRNVDNNHRERNLNIRIEPISFKNDVRYARDENDYGILLFEHGMLQENIRRTRNGHMTRNRKEKNINLGNMLTKIRSIDMFSRDDISGRSAFLETQDDTRKIIYKQLARNRGELSTPVRNKSKNIRNYERYSKETIRDKTLCLERDVCQENGRRVTNTEMTRKREKRNIDIGNEPIEIRNKQRFSRYNIRNSKLYLERRISHEDRRRTVDTETLRKQEERNTKRRNEPIYTTNYASYARHKSPESTLLFERGILKENIKSITNSYTTRNRNERNQKVRNEPSENRSYVRYSRDSSGDRNSCLERDICKHTTRTIYNGQTLRSREERNSLTGNGQFVIRNIENYVTEKFHDKTSYLDRSVRRENTRRIMKRDMVGIRREQDTYLRNQRSDLRNYYRYSKDGARENILADRDMHEQDVRGSSRAFSINDREIRYTYVRDESSNIKNDKKYSKDTEKEGSFEHELLQQGAELVDGHNGYHAQNVLKRYGSKYFGDYKMYLRENNREVSTIPTRNHYLENTYYQKYSKDRISDALQRGVRNQEDRTPKVKLLVRKRVSTPNINDKDERIDFRKSKKLDAKYSGDRAISSVYHMQRLYARTIIHNNIYDRLSQRTRNVHTDMKNQEKSQENIRKVAILSEDNMWHSERNILSLNSQRKTHGIKEVSGTRNIEMYSRDDTKKNKHGNRDHLDNRNIPLNMNRETVTNRENVNRLVSNSKITERHFKDTARGITVTDRIARNKDLRREFYQPRTGLIKTLSSTIHNKQTNESSVVYWQYLFYALQGIYIISILMRENTKTNSTAWLTSAMFLKVK